MDCSMPDFPVHHQLPLNWWCHPTISSSVVPFSSCLQSFPASGSFQMSQFFTSGGQSIGVSTSASVLPMNIQDWFPLGWTGWISLLSKLLSRVFSNTIVQKHQFFGVQFLYSPTLTSIHDYWKNRSFDQTDLCWQSTTGQHLMRLQHFKFFVSPPLESFKFKSLNENCPANDAHSSPPILVSHPDLSHVSEPCGQWLPGPSGLGFASSYYTVHSSTSSQPFINPCLDYFVAR